MNEQISLLTQTILVTPVSLVLHGDEPSASLQEGVGKIIRNKQLRVGVERNRGGSKDKSLL